MVRVVLAVVAGLGIARAAAAYPPYKSTDADTADPWTLELRLGLFGIEREKSRNIYSAPLLRLNFGLPGSIEINSEFEYQPVDGRVAEAALGAKWIPLVGKVSVGLEAVALLPVSSAGGAGFEGALLTTVAAKPVSVHVNASGYFDGRGATNERGWKAGAIGEVRAGRFRPGVEMFAKGAVDEAVQVSAGAGVIVDLGPVDVRVGARLGLTAAAADFVTTLWFTTKVPFASKVRAAPIAHNEW
ncbi:MAG: hypothetical protein HYY84_02180 [Deltaproteobacteria bacterium]|nr:hypothetical protein [Deltaproteobacteria bacterium]